MVMELTYNGSWDHYIFLLSHLQGSQTDPLALEASRV